MSNNAKFVIIAILVIVIISAILLGLSFERVRYDEYVILKNNFSHRFITDREFNESGIYFIGIEKSFIKFPKYLIFNDFTGKNSTEEAESFNKLKVVFYAISNRVFTVPFFKDDFDVLNDVYREN